MKQSWKLRAAPLKTNILQASIAKAGMDDPTKVAAVMADLEWNGGSGAIKFDQQHNPIKSIVIMQVKNGQARYVETVNP